MRLFRNPFLALGCKFDYTTLVLLIRKGTMTKLMKI